ncbi:MAG: thioredoxin family protein, partial [Bacteroidota bacterium]|nr:thioredoxin family protein [Bacteroidota bacterium]
MARNIFFGFAFLLAGLAVDMAGNVKINFLQDDFSQALRLAKKQKKPLFVYFSTDHCGACRQLERFCMSQDDVGEFFNDNFISVHLNPEEGAAGLAGKWGVRGVPAMLYVDTKKNIVHKTVGYKDKEHFMEESRKALEIWKSTCVI